MGRLALLQKHPHYRGMLVAINSYIPGGEVVLRIKHRIIQNCKLARAKKAKEAQWENSPEHVDIWRNCLAVPVICCCSKIGKGYWQPFTLETWKVGICAAWNHLVFFQDVLQLGPW